MLVGGFDCGGFFGVRTYFTSCCLSSKDASIVKSRVALPSAEVNGYLGEVLRVTTSVVGKEARWLGAGDCHDDILTGTWSTKKRRREMFLVTGRRLVFFELGVLPCQLQQRLTGHVCALQMCYLVCTWPDRCEDAEDRG